MSMKIKHLLSLLWVILLPSLYALGYRNGHKGASGKIVEKSDTIEVIKTIREPIPEPYEVRVTEYVFLPVKDTIRLRDTLLMAIPRTEKAYKTSSYMAIVSGVFPSLDFIETYSLTQTITKTIKEPRSPWGLSVGLGPSVIYSPFYGGFDAGIGIFAGVAYSF